MVGGVSIGAFMGAVWCGERDIIGMIRKAGHWAKVHTMFKLTCRLKKMYLT